MAGTLGALASRMHEGDAIPDVPPDSALVLHALHPQTMLGLWYQRLGRPGMTQLAHLQQHATGLPAHKQLHVHPFHECQVCHDARVHKQPAGLSKT
jgi:hypothetical protein